MTTFRLDCVGTTEGGALVVVIIVGVVGGSVRQSRNHSSYFAIIEDLVTRHTDHPCLH